MNSIRIIPAFFTHYKSAILTLILLFLISIVVFRPLLTDQIMESDDYPHHAARTANYYLALKQGQLPPRWAPNLDRSYGYPVFNYSYHLPYALGSVFHATGFSIQQSLNLTVLVFILFGLAGIFILARINGLNLLASSLLSLVYWINPYTLLTVFWRGAVGELAFYALVPFIFLCIQKILDTKTSNGIKVNFSLALSLLWSLTLLCHIPSAIVLAFVLGLYALIKIITQSKDVPSFFRQPNLWLLIAAIVLGTALSAWYVGPALLERWMISYNSGSSLSQHVDQFVTFKNLFTLTSSTQSSQLFLEVVSIGLMSIAVLAFVIYLLVSRRETLKERWAYIFWFAIATFSVLLISQHSLKVWDLFYLLQLQQYPWRLLWLVNFSCLILAFQLLKDLSHTLKNILLLTIAASILLHGYNYAHPKGFTSRTDYDWFQTFATGSSFDEFRPIWHTSNTDLSEDIIFFDPNSGSEMDVAYKVSTWNGSRKIYSTTLPQPVTVIHKTTYFPGWQVVIDNNQANISHQTSSYEGLASYPLSSGSHEIELAFSASTQVRRISEAISLIAIAITILIFIFRKRLSKYLAKL